MDVNAYNLTFAVLSLTGATLGDRFGRSRMFTVGLAVFTAASVACALSSNIGALIAAGRCRARAPPWCCRYR